MGPFTATVCCLVVLGCFSAPSDLNTSKSGPQDADFTRALAQLAAGTYENTQDKQGLGPWEYSSRSAEFQKALQEVRQTLYLWSGVLQRMYAI